MFVRCLHEGFSDDGVFRVVVGVVLVRVATSAGFAVAMVATGEGFARVLWVF